MPQGSFLGPLLFLISINDIGKCSEILSIILFDTNGLFFSHENLDTVHETMNCELRKIVTRLSANKLSLNIKTTHFLILNPGGRNLIKMFQLK